MAHYHKVHVLPGWRLTPIPPNPRIAAIMSAYIADKKRETHCHYTGDLLLRPPVRGNWLSFLSPKALARVKRNNDRINAWLNSYNLIEDSLPHVPCHRSRSIMTDTLVPKSASINPGERKFVVGLWVKYTNLFQQACWLLTLPDLAKLVDRLVNLENLYMANWSQVAHAIEVINDYLASYIVQPLQLLSPAPVLALPAPPCYRQLPARCLTSEIREQLNSAIGINSNH